VQKLNRWLAVALGCILIGLGASSAWAEESPSIDEGRATPHVESDSIFYGRLGYGAIFDKTAQGVPAVGLLGYRHELDSMAVDISFFNFALTNNQNAYGSARKNVGIGSWMKLEALKYLKPLENTSAYAGGGLSWGSGSSRAANETLNGSGLQGELTIGYETGRSSAIRAFIQADATLPFYELASNGYAPAVYNPATRSYGPGVAPAASRRYSPCVVVSFGLGWQRGGR
jgi:hypothetical protein